MKNKFDLDILIIVVLMFFLLSCSDEKQNAEDDNLIPVRVTKVKKEIVPIIIRTSGKIVSSSIESKLSFKVPGLVQSINVKAGQAVKMGDLLASLDLSEMNSNLKNAENGYEKAKRDLGESFKSIP